MFFPFLPTLQCPSGIAAPLMVYVTAAAGARGQAHRQPQHPVFLHRQPLPPSQPLPQMPTGRRPPRHLGRCSGRGPAKPSWTSALRATAVTEARSGPFITSRCCGGHSPPLCTERHLLPYSTGRWHCRWTYFFSSLKALLLLVLCI